MLKGFVLGEEKDIVRILMKGKNLFPQDSLTGKTTVVRDTFNEIGSSIVFGNGQYTLSMNATTESTVGIFKLCFTYTDDSQDKSVWISNKSPSVALVSNAAKVVKSISITDYNMYVDVTLSNIMLNIGSTVLPYEPYGYQNGWEVRDNQNRIVWGREDELETITGTLPFKGYDLPIKIKSLLGNSAQNGIPSPDSPIVPEFCGVRTENLINIYANNTSNGYIDNTILRSGGYLYTPSYSFVSEYQPINENVTYTLNTGGKTGNSQSICFYTSNKQFISGVAYENRTIITFTTPHGARYFRCTVMRIQSDTESYKHTMLNVGTEPLPFEPYGYKISFENNGENLFDASKFDLIPVTETASRKGTNLGVLPQGIYTLSAISTESPTPIYRTIKNGTTYTFEAINSLPYTFTADGVSEQIIRTSGTSGNTWEDVGYSNIMLNLGSTPKPYSPYLNATIPVYLGEVPTVRQIKKYEFTGTEALQTSGSGNARFFYMTIADARSWATIISDRYVNASVQSTTEEIGVAMSGNSQFRIRPDTTSTVEEYKQYLAAQYAAGHPVTVWYVLANEQTGIVNEPLCKISTYTDELTTIQVHGLSAPLYGIGDYKDVLNLSTGVVTMKVKKLVLDGVNDGEWKKSQTRTGSFYLNVGVNAIVSLGLCDRAVNVSTVSQYDSIGQMFVESSGSTKLINLWLFDTNLSLDDFKSYLAAQYQAGTPVTVWYVLNTPETETVTVPTGMTGEIEGYLTQISTPTPEHQSIPKWNGEEETGGTYAVTVYNLPEIPTTTGKNTLTVDTTLAPYNVIVDGHIKYTYWGKIREDVRSGLAQTKFPVGTILYDNEDETTGRAFQVVGYDKHFDPSLTARGYTHSMTLCQLKLSGPWQFDATEAFLYTTVEMQPGTYKFKIPNYDTTYGGNKTYYFTSTASVPVDSQITLSWAYQQPPKTVTAYAGPNPQTKTTAITGFNALQLSEWIEGESPEAIDLGTIKLANNDPDSAYGKLNHIHRARYGSNNYYQSGLRQLLNTDLASNNWWHPTTIFDRPYANRTTNGYLRSLNEDFINVLATPEITHIANNIFEYPSLDGRTFTLNTEYKINTDKVFLLSHTEVGLSASPNIGTVLDYYSTHNTNNDRIKYRIDNGNAYYWWLRTPYPSRCDSVRRVNTSGALDNNNSHNSVGVAAACIIQ